MKSYDVIIIGGGPTGIALGIELGLNHVNTLILEKHSAPLLSPRAQSLNARSMEFFIRWRIDDTLKEKRLLPSNYPIQGVWCSKLNGQTYAVSSSNESLNDELTPERGVRIPLWLTEEVLRNRLQQFPSVNFIKHESVIDVVINDKNVFVTAKDINNQIKIYSAPYVVACDGANSITRNKAGINFKQLAEPKRSISVLFESPDLENMITVSKGFLFYILESALPGAIGPIDPANGLWAAQFGYNGHAETIDQVNVDELLERLSGLHFTKKIIKAHFWNMHIQMAEQFSCANRIFLVGDSAHAFVPTGGFGLNTGLGDVVNLGWKLAAVLKHKAHPFILATYEQERLPVCLHNLKLAQKNADDMMALKNRIDPKQNPEEFAKANAALAKQFAYSSGSTMGYAYFDSPLIHLRDNQSTSLMPNVSYTPIVAPGYFLPHSWVEERKSIYSVLSATHWTLIVSDENISPESRLMQVEFDKHHVKLDILCIKQNQYRYIYIIIRPDWHIAFASNEINSDYLEKNLKLFFKSS